MVPLDISDLNSIYLKMWGGMTAVAVRHNRPKHLADGKLRPTNLNLLKTSGLGPGHGPGGTDSPGKLSAAPSRAGSPSHEVVTPFSPSPSCDTKKIGVYASKLEFSLNKYRGVLLK